MKNKLNVFGALFIAAFMGAEIQQGNVSAAAIDFLLAVLNLWFAGFFED